MKPMEIANFYLSALAFIVSLIFFLSVNGCGTGNNPSYGYRPSDNCSVSTINSPISGSLIQCPDGTSSFVNNGSNGINGTVISVVQFCPGTTTYPTEFNEVGLCINNNLWAVYSSNGGFFTEVLPGTWSSDGINSSCDFQVGPNCTILSN